MNQEKINGTVNIQLTKHGFTMITDPNNTKKFAKIFVKDSPVDSLAYETVERLVKGLDCKKISIMPDVHPGEENQVIGSVFETENTLYPQLIGSDIGCGILVKPLKNIDYDSFCKNMDQIVERILKRVPVGRNNFPLLNPNVKIDPNEKYSYIENFITHLKDNYISTVSDQLVIHSLNDYGIIGKCHNDKNDLMKSARTQGTLGGGNHFIEFVRDEKQKQIYCVIHSGSRRFGSSISRYIDNYAKRICNAYGDNNCIKPYIKNIKAFDVSKNNSEFENSINAIMETQKEAEMNRSIMFSTIQYVINEFVKENDIKFSSDKDNVLPVIDSMHNFIELSESKDGQIMKIITRKGAQKTYCNGSNLELDVILPTYMGGPLFIGKGKNNSDSIQSCSHGCGRLESRTNTKKAFKDNPEKFKIKDYPVYTTEVYDKNEISVIKGYSQFPDEFEEAYKNYETVISDQKDLFEVTDKLTPILTIKGK